MPRVRKADSSPSGPSKKACHVSDVDTTYDTSNAEQDEEARSGNIIRVKMKNFMTYSNVEFVPGRRLNLILGPNGTGKSSFVCAICIGLAGKPSLLGRGDKVSEFIKRGEDSAEVSITLCTEDLRRPLLITRVIRKDNSSDWKMNGKTVTAAIVNESIKALNVQLDNLCQFLPQDRVVAFSQLKPTELLLETEKAVGNAELLKMHQDLINMRNNIKGLETRVQTNRATLERYQEQNKVLERDVERVNERNLLLEEVEDLRKKVPWLEFEVAKEQWEATRAEFKNCRKELKERAALLFTARQPLENKTAQKKQAEVEHKAIKQELIQLDKKRVLQEDELLKLANDAESVVIELQNLKKTARTRQDKIAKAKLEIGNLEAELEGLQEPPDSAEEAERVKVELRSLSEALKDLQNKKAETEDAAALPRRQLGEVKNRLRQLDDVRNQRVRTLAQNDRKVMQAYEWVEANRGRFRNHVYGPILAEVEPDSQQNAKYLEQACAGYLWSSFVTTCDEDRNIMAEELGKKLGITVINFAGDPTLPIAVPAELPNLESVGIMSTLDMTFTAPMAVKHVLNDHAGTARTYVGTQATENMMTTVSQNRAVSSVFTPVSHYVNSTSHYSGHVTSRVVAVRPNRLFQQSAPAGEKDLLQTRMRDFQNDVASAEQQLAAIQEEGKATDAKLREKRQVQEALLKRRQDYVKQRSRLTNSVQQKKVQLSSLEKQNEAQEEQRLTKKCAKVNEKRLDKLMEMHGLFMRYGDMQLSMDPVVLTMAECDAHIAHLKLEVSGLEAEGQQLNAEKERLDRKSTQDKEQAMRLKTLAGEKAKLPDADLEAKFATMPGTVEEVKEAILEKKREVDEMFIRDPNVLIDYQDRQKKINELTGTVEAEDDLLENGQSKIEELKGKWLPQLKEMVEKMGRTFAESFEAIGCVGEVGLVEDENFDKYEMRIRVKFRAEEELQTLSSHRQSGGERSVSTMLYLIALQEFTKCPFRVVDEINQGMDAVNERKIFTKMVEAACRPDTPQCFLLTPKLLPQLEYSPAVTILNIMNGPRIKTVSQNWNPSRSYKFYKPNPAAVR